MIRFGGPVFGHFEDAESWAQAHADVGYRATYAPPMQLTREKQGVARVRGALADRDLVLAEVGAWVNPLSPDSREAAKARVHIVDQLRLADALGARCCVDIVGSTSTRHWDGATPEGYSQRFFDAVVITFQDIIDEADPQNAVMAFEAMPYDFLDGPGPYQELLDAIDRPGQTGVHVDLSNMITTPRRLYGSADLATQVFSELGPQVQSCHLKDLVLDDSGGTVKFLEVMPGRGELDLAAYFRAAESACDGMPMMLEHLDAEEDYDRARARVFDIADKTGIER